VTRAIVLSGGGVRGAFEAGVVRELVLYGERRYDTIVGTSAGALNAAVLAARPKEDQHMSVLDLVGFWRGIRSHDDVFRTSVWQDIRALLGLSPSLFDTSPLRSRLTQALAGSSGTTRVAVVRTALEIGNRRLLITKGCYLSERIDHVLASASIPGLFQPVRVENEWCVDGGLVDDDPLDVVRDVDREVTEVDLVTCEPTLGKADRVGSAYDVVARSLAIMDRTLFRARIRDVARLEGVKVNVYAFPASEASAGDVLDFRPETIERFLEVGQRVARKGE
jgi:NTE family protein